MSSAQFTTSMMCASISSYMIAANSFSANEIGRRWTASRFTASGRPGASITPQSIEPCESMDYLSIIGIRKLADKEFESGSLATSIPVLGWIQ
jgi:hypothetical protein